MALTKGEVVQVFGRALIYVGEQLDEEDAFDSEEIFALTQQVIADLVKEYSD